VITLILLTGKERRTVMFNKAVMRVIAPIIKALEDRIAALEAKVQ
jgi:hypothetical protein